MNIEAAFRDRNNEVVREHIRVWPVVSGGPNGSFRVVKKGMRGSLNRPPHEHRSAPGVDRPRFFLYSRNLPNMSIRMFPSPLDPSPGPDRGRDGQDILFPV